MIGRATRGSGLGSATATVGGIAGGAIALENELDGDEKLDV